MRHAGGLRIDHVMDEHLYWVPAGRPPQEGAYVRYPMEDLVGILAWKVSGTAAWLWEKTWELVHPDFRDRMAKAAILSYRVLIFEQDSSTGEFTTPAAYPRLSVAVAGNHDLPTIRAWWEGLDIDLKKGTVGPILDCGAGRSSPSAAAQGLRGAINCPRIRGPAARIRST